MDEEPWVVLQVAACIFQMAKAKSKRRQILAKLISEWTQKELH
jgi:hypothetical protein